MSNYIFELTRRPKSEWKVFELPSKTKKTSAIVATKKNCHQRLKRLAIKDRKTFSPSKTKNTCHERVKDLPSKSKRLVFVLPSI